MAVAVGRIVAPRLWGHATAPASVLLPQLFASPASYAPPQIVRFSPSLKGPGQGSAGMYLDVHGGLGSPGRQCQTVPGRIRASMAGLDCLASAGAATLRKTRAGAREYGVRPRRTDDAHQSEPGRNDERDRLVQVLRDDECIRSPLDASANRRRASSISPLGNAHTRSTGLWPDARLAADRAGNARVEVAELDARQSRSRRLQMDWEEVEETPKKYALWGVIGANCLVFLLWQDTSMRRFMGIIPQKYASIFITS